MRTKYNSDKALKLFLENLPKLVVSVWLIIILKKVGYWISNFDFSFGSLGSGLGGEVSTAQNEEERIETIEKEVENYNIRFLNDGTEVTATILNAHAKILVSEGFGWNLPWWAPSYWTENEKVIVEVLSLYSIQTFKFISDAYRLVTIDTNKEGRDLLTDLISKLSASDIESLEHLRGIGLIV
jgi:hypothetical protein